MSMSVILCDSDEACLMDHPDPDAGPSDSPWPDDEAHDEPEAEPCVGRSRGQAAESLDNVALARLIARVMRQDEDALAALYAQLSGRVYALAMHLTRRVASAEEVLQDTFWQVWRQAPRFDAERGTAVSWILTIARSRALDAIRAAARDPVQTPAQSLDEACEPGPPGVDTDPMDLLDAVRRDSALHASLAALDPLRRQLISLAFFRGLTHDEIADHTGLPLGTVKSHVRRSLAALQAALGADLSTGPIGSVR